MLEQINHDSWNSYESNEILKWRFWWSITSSDAAVLLQQFTGYAQAVQTTELEFHIDLLKVCILNSFVMIFEGFQTK